MSQTPEAQGGCLANLGPDCGRGGHQESPGWESFRTHAKDSQSAFIYPELDGHFGLKRILASNPGNFSNGPWKGPN